MAEESAGTLVRPTGSFVAQGIAHGVQPGTWWTDGDVIEGIKFKLVPQGGDPEKFYPIVFASQEKAAQVKEGQPVTLCIKAYPRQTKGGDLYTAYKVA